MRNLGIFLISIPIAFLFDIFLTLISISYGKFKEGSSKSEGEIGCFMVFMYFLLINGLNFIFNS